MEMGTLGKGFLRKLPLTAKFSDSLPKRNPEVLHASHRADSARGLT